MRGSQGLWRAAIYNPMHIYKISYNLTVSRTAACLNNCSQHGTCTPDGLCHCEGDWYDFPLWERSTSHLCNCQSYLGLDIQFCLANLPCHVGVTYIKPARIWLFMWHWSAPSAVYMLRTG